MSEEVDRELVVYILSAIKIALERIAVRFSTIEKPEDFLSSEMGVEKLDSICMQLLAVGEGIKRLDRETGGTLFTSYPDVDWKGMKGLRDILSHHYFDIDAEQIFWISQKELPRVQSAICQLITNMSPIQ